MSKHYAIIHAMTCENKMNVFVMGSDCGVMGSLIGADSKFGPGFDCVVKTLRFQVLKANGTCIVHVYCVMHVCILMFAWVKRTRNILKPRN